MQMTRTVGDARKDATHHKLIQQYAVDQVQYIPLGKELVSATGWTGYCGQQKVKRLGALTLGRLLRTSSSSSWSVV